MTHTVTSNCIAEPSSEILRTCACNIHLSVKFINSAVKNCSAETLTNLTIEGGFRCDIALLFYGFTVLKFLMVKT